jgi:iron complex transport system permease protein
MSLKNLLLMLAALFMALFLLFYGEVGFTSNADLLWQIRLPKIVACFFAGGLLAIAGLLMQIFFQNPLAGPDILGVSSGSSLFVALWILLGTSLPPLVQSLGVSAMSFLGALSVFSLLLFFVHKNLSRVSLIIIGLLISAFASSCISLLVSLSSASSLKNFLMWSMGSFRNLNLNELSQFLILSFISLIPLLLLKKSLNQFLLSEQYAQSMGLNIKKMKYISSRSTFTGGFFDGGFIGVFSRNYFSAVARKSHLDKRYFGNYRCSFNRLFYR